MSPSAVTGGLAAYLSSPIAANDSISKPVPPRCESQEVDQFDGSLGRRGMHHVARSGSLWRVKRTPHVSVLGNLRDEDNEIGSSHRSDCAEVQDRATYTRQWLGSGMAWQAARCQ
jgi:hypothetical protein